MTSEFFGRQRECRFHTAGCVNKMAVSVTGPRAVNELGSPVIPGSPHNSDSKNQTEGLQSVFLHAYHYDFLFSEEVTA